MNFSYLNTKPGEKHDLSCVVLSVEPTKYNDNGKPFNKCTLQDAQGVQNTMKIYQGNNPPLTPQHVGQSLIFAIKKDTYNGKQYHQGFWQCPNPQEVQQPPQQQAPPPQQSMSKNVNYQAPPPENVQQGEPRRSDVYAYEHTPETSARIARSVGAECASRWAIGRQDISPTDMISTAISISDWIITGNIPMAAAQDAQGEEIPF